MYKMGVFTCLCVLALLVQAFAIPTGQIPLQEEPENGRYVSSSERATKTRPLYGRFLHITDFHPDRFYEVYSSTSKDAACHRGQGPAGIYGAESSDCDSPVDLINKTMDWVEKEFKENIDFVVWTGDSARHDNDEDLPRSEAQVVELNQFMVQKMFEVFGKRNGDERDDNPNNDYVVPIIPTFGNNDILPHNIFRNGPNKWTRTYAKMWRQFIPEEQKHQFEQGGWFYVEVIPNKLAVFSLNTIYFFTSNAATDGCAVTSEPGYLQMEWLRIQLRFMRQRGMKVILTGHVPPAREEAKTSWDETCWQKYTLWNRQYRDIIVGSLYGHFNYDHFILQDFKDLRKGTKKGKMPDYSTEDVDGEIHSTVSSRYFIELRNSWSKLPDLPKSLTLLEDVKQELTELRNSEQPWNDVKALVLDVLKSKKKKKKSEEQKYYEKIGGEFAERYSASFVSASVVPNLYPTLRVFEYNITGLDGNSDFSAGVRWSLQPRQSLSDYETMVEKRRLKTMKTMKTIKTKKYKFEIPEPPSKSSPPGPAYSPQTFSLIRYTQYLANLTRINNDFPVLSREGEDEIEASKWNEGKHKGKKPHSKDHTPNPKKFKFELHYDTKDDDVYQLEDLTMPSLLDLARRIGNFVPEDELLEEHAKDDVRVAKKKDNKKKRKKQRELNKVWYAFVRRAFVETLSDEELKDEFGD